jgi:hypothetical protein
MENCSKEEYINWCIEIVKSRQISDKMKEKDYSYKILCIIKNFILEKIKKLGYKEEEKERLLKNCYTNDKINNLLYELNEIDIINKEIEIIWNTIDENDTNYIGKINMGTFLLLLIISKYEKNKQDPIYNSNYCEIIDNYKKYNALKNDLHFRFRTEIVLGYIDDPETFYLPNIFFLKHEEILYYWLEYKIWFLGVQPYYLYVDGNHWKSPKFFYLHDAAHSRWYNNLDEKYICENKIIIVYNIIKNFYKYCINKYNKTNSDILYSLLLTIFIVVHDANLHINIFFGNASDKIILYNNIVGVSDKIINRLCNYYDLYKTLPKNLRKAICEEKNTVSLQIANLQSYEIREKIKKYFFEECVYNFVNELHIWQKESFCINIDNYIPESKIISRSVKMLRI